MSTYNNKTKRKIVSSWISDIIKIVILSRSLTASIFVTSLFLYYWLPNQADLELPSYVPVIVVSLAIFTGCLILLDLLIYIKNAFIEYIENKINIFRSYNLSDTEKKIVRALGEHYPTILNKNVILNNIQNHNIRLNIDMACSSLQEKGYIDMYSYLISGDLELTEKGKKKASEL